ncbi:unnamed protein product [Dovyalis caffra]|uniref:Uncharacterized protein n=1 Tax=Dovyalis caffra TaxID=77055 RepID=A0AAV1QPD7_9ROSI|nr:unnamed protein product [Dovyalis caffra]
MEQSSSETRKRKYATEAALPEHSTIRSRKKEQQQQPSLRNPLQDLNNGGIASTGIDNTSNASSLSYTESSKGYLRFFLSHASSSKTTKAPLKNGGNNTQRQVKVKPFSSKTPKSAPSMRPSKEKSPRKKLFDKPISKEVEKGKRKHPPCLYQWQSGKKLTSYRKGIHDSSKVCFFLESNGSLVSNNLKSGSGEFEKVIIDGVCEGNEANLTLCKVASGSGLNFGVDGSCKTDTNSTSSNTKTPPIQPSASPEIQCGSSMKLMTEKMVTPPTCYGAGHVFSGVTDKRKCKPRGMLLSEGKAKASGSFDTDDNTQQENEIGLVENSDVSILPLPIEASVHWFLSPPDEEDEDQKKNS